LEQHPLESTPASKVHSICSTARSRKGIDLVYDIDPAVPPIILTDAYRLRQVLLNLTSNALSSPTVEKLLFPFELLRSRRRAHTLIRRYGHRTSAYRRKSAHGCFSRILKQTLRPSRHYGGTGLGLAISQRLVQLLGGTMHVESEQGKAQPFLFPSLHVPHLLHSRSIFTTICRGWQNAGLLVTTIQGA